MRHTGLVSSFLGNRYMNLFPYKETHFFQFIQFSSLLAPLCNLVAHIVGSSVPKSKIRATGSCLLYAGRPLEQLPSDVSAERTAVVPFWVRCVSHFTSWYLRRFRHRFLSSAWVAGVALRSFRLRTSVHCQRASHPGSCRDPTQAAHPSHRSSSVALLGTLALR